MTNANAASANDTGLPVLLRHIGEMQTKAMQLKYLLAAINALDNEGGHDGEITVMAGLSERLASELDEGLDAVNLPGVSA